jgi:hypothetical protein
LVHHNPPRIAAEIALVLGVALILKDLIYLT